MSVAEATRPGPPRGRGADSDRGFRPEVQGLRALAVLMVVSYHIWFGRVSGGVDIFLLISAFLLSLSFLRRIEGGKPLDLAQHWLHQFKRLLPAVVVVILGVLGASYVLVPPSRWPDIIEQSWASLFYVQNWVLASNAVDYYADDHSLASPLQHFWSLSVQGQVFILWPLLFLASALLARRFRLRVRGVVMLVFGAVFVASLGFSIWETYTNQAYAYFDTRARLWEFALGTLLALALPFVRLPRSLRIVAGWVGVAAMLSGGFILDVQGQFPGYVALWPLLAAALVILAGQTGSAIGADRFLSAKPLVRVGDLSYALYLWHWPVLVLALVWQDRPSPGLLGGFIIIAVSLVLAYLTMRFVERPLRALAWADKRRRRAVVVLAVSVGLVAAPLAAWQHTITQEARNLAAEADTNNPGALVLDPLLGISAPAGVPPIPATTEMDKEYFQFDEACAGEDVPAAELIRDACYVVEPPSTPVRDIVVVGDSHSQQWAVPLAAMAQERGWKMTFVLLGGCKYGAGPEGRTPECEQWNATVTDYVLQQAPDLVYTVGTVARSDDPQDVLPAGFARIARMLDDRGIQVVAVRDNPRFGTSRVLCVETQGADSPACNPPRAATLSDQPPVAELLGQAPNVAFLDFTDYLCRDEVCPAVIGNVFVYIDDNHVSASYLRSMLPIFTQRFDEAVGP
ncbi:acyltransferase [Arthrobacter pityocampae]|uniref:Acyltransferase n=1 Tax=Arthrobacter pityocampae TaxID=547334 RepID=A0A2S5J1T1_9MICC|nr:acyltransferase family protein [Arthrobacter pityocampae]PPB50786.1 acyltransferase [Arthrobacter pityocampae]